MKKLKLKKENQKGVTLIALIVTIVVLLILAGVSVAILTGENGLLAQANESDFKTKLGTLDEQLKLFKQNKLIENQEFKEDTLNASKDFLQYNTKVGEDGNIETIFSTLEDEEKERIEIIKGQIVYNTQSALEVKWLQELGIEPNPYDIVDGELQSSDSNLLLMDSTGTVTIPSTVTKIGLGAFRNLQGLKTIIIPGTCTEIGDYAFSGNTTLEKVIIEDGVQKIGAFAFEDCTVLKEVEMPNSITTVGDTLFGSCKALEEIKLSNNLKTMPYRMFSGCSNLKNIEIPEGVEGINSVVFEGCSLITEIEIPSTIKVISTGAFSGMSGLTNIKIDESNTTYTFVNGMLLSYDRTILYYALSNLTTLEIPSTIKVIEASSLNSCSKITKINIPKSVTNIKTIFNGNVQSIIVEEGNTAYKSINGNLYTISGDTLIKYCSNEETVILPNEVKVIGTYAFYGQNKIRNLTLSSNLTTISDFALQGTSINSLNIPKNVNSISISTFVGLNVDITIATDYSIR